MIPNNYIKFLKHSIAAFTLFLLQIHGSFFNSIRCFKEVTLGIKIFYLFVIEENYEQSF